MREARPLRAYAEVALGRQRSPQHDAGPHMVSYLRAANVKDGHLDLSDVKQMNFTPLEQQRFSLKPGDVLVTEGSGSLAAVGASAVWNGELEETVCFQNTLLRLRPRPSTDYRFLAWWCRYAFGDGLFASIATGANIHHVSAERVRAIPMTALSLPVQRAIAGYLDTETARIDALITKKRRMIELLERRYIQTVTELVFRHGRSEGHLRTHTVTKPQKVLEHHLASADPSWEVVPLRRVAHLSSTLNSDGEASLLSLTIRGETVPRPPDRQPPGPEYLLRYNRVFPGQLVVNPMWLVGGSIGVASRSGAVSPDYRVYDLDSRLRPAFAHHLLRSEPYRDQYQLLMRADTTFDRRVTKDDFHEVLVPVPSISEQDLICERLDLLAARLDPVREGLRRQIELLAERRRAMITAAVTGELAIPGVAA